MQLTKAQSRLAEREYRVAAVIKGNVHTGKTSIGLARMYYLTHQKQGKSNDVLYIMQKEAACEVTSKRYQEVQQGQNISLFEEEFRNVETCITSTEALMSHYFRMFSKHKKMKIVYEVPEDLLLEQILAVKKAYPRIKWLNADAVEFVSREIDLINACGYEVFEAYEQADRKGAMMKLPKKGVGRKALWQIREAVHQALKAQHHILYSMMQLEVLGLIKGRNDLKQYGHIIVDDAEQLTKVELEFIKALGHEDGDILFLMGKETEVSSVAWLGLGHHFKTIGYNMTGKTTTLKQKAKKKVSKKVVKPVETLTPLEEFILHFVPTQKEEKKVAKVTIREEDIDFANQMTLDELVQSNESSLPWYVDTYKYINKATGVETIFQSDSSAGEIYVEDELQDPDSIDALPIYSSDIAAGAPIEIVEEISGSFHIPGELIHHKKNTYVLHVQGDSMIGAAIDDGDYVVIQAGNVNNNEIAAVYYNGATTLKRIVQQGEHVMLVSENPKYGPIIIDDGEFRVMGKLIGVIKPM